MAAFEIHAKLWRMEPEPPSSRLTHSPDTNTIFTPCHQGYHCQIPRRFALLICIICDNMPSSMHSMLMQRLC